MFITKLWRGEYSLVKTYWVFNVLIGNVVLGNIISFIDPIKNAYVFLAGLGLYLLYMLLAIVGLWRSASLYKGNELWKILAKISVVIGVLFFLFFSYKVLSEVKIDSFQKSVILRSECQIKQLSEAGPGLEMAILIKSIPYCQKITRASMVDALGGDIQKLENQIKEENLDPLNVEGILVKALVKEKRFSPIDKYKSVSECQIKELKKLKNVKEQGVYIKLVDDYCEQYIAISGSIKHQYDLGGAVDAGYTYKEIASYIDQNK
jgi:hypothetical protein